MRIFLSVLGLSAVAFLVSFLFVRGPGPVEVSPYGVVDTPYLHGYRLGYASLRRQMGEDFPMPPSARYVTGLDEHEVSEEEKRGYVDGYHRACELMSCPAR